MPSRHDPQPQFADPTLTAAHRAALRSLDRVVEHTAEPTDPALALQAVTEQLAAGGVLILTGAGVSTDSGIPDYRGPNGSLRRSRPMTFQEFQADPAARQRYWARGFVGTHRMAQARPNLGHAVIADWQRRGLASGIITQNVDGLHTAAGARDVITLHGDMRSVSCLDCDTQEPREHFDERLEAANPGYRESVELGDEQINADGDVSLDAATVARFHTVRCEVCGSDRLKPSVVYFGENVPAAVHAAADALKDASRSLLVVGSSLAVMSGYRFVLDAAGKGKRSAVINGGPGRADAKVDVLWRTQVTPALEEVDAALRRRGL
ncbi:Sir2 family NAD-dependent protein deacetylase [Galactobacter caseinivorans]|uniref:protein acetyllysine N-acetyltransferase n=1 Tax=Galactobacter caseinivorans TaxID=2676123 RepID=A0A496PLG3_9MICC|nr:Sir2 family NAD-dependent protein deacetylase [Galactobacter caseinivorans]RKW71306.1 NAD-dependent protein deacetylase [Galactobacter caseinivorans]